MGRNTARDYFKMTEIWFSINFARFTIGWWLTKVSVLCLVNTVVTSLIFSAVSGGSMSTIVGIVVFGIIVWFVLLERYA